MLTRPTNKRTHILPPNEYIWGPRGRGEKLRCRFRRRLLFPKYFALSFLLGMSHEDCSVCIFHRSVLQRPRLRPMTRVNPVRLLGCWECGDRRLKLFSRSGMIKSTNVLPITYWRDQPQTGAERKHQVTSRPLPGLRRLDRIPGHDSQSDSRAVSTWSQKPPGLSMVFKLQGCLGDNRHPSYSPKKRARSPKACIHLASP